MKSSMEMKGLAYNLRPVEQGDAEFIVQVRLEDAERNRFIHRISPDVELQRQWIAAQQQREGDYYFIVENNFTKEPEGLISLYNIDESTAEWGRWVIKKGSFAALESVLLVWRLAFHKLHLNEVYARTVADNAAAVRFHDSIHEVRRGLLPGLFELDGVAYDAVEHYVTRELFEGSLEDHLEEKAHRIYMRFLTQHVGEMTFHHLGVASADMRADYEAYRLLGYRKEGAPFEDEQQGIRGQFIHAPNHPRLELLENLEGSSTLTYWLQKKTKIYHTAYLVKDIEKARTVFLSLGARMLSPMKPSVYFGQRICFLMLRNSHVFELIESK